MRSTSLLSSLIWKALCVVTWLCTCCFCRCLCVCPLALCRWGIPCNVFVSSVGACTLLVCLHASRPSTTQGPSPSLSLFPREEVLFVLVVSQCAFVPMHLFSHMCRTHFPHTLVATPFGTAPSCSARACCAILVLFFACVFVVLCV